MSQLLQDFFMEGMGKGMVTGMAKGVVRGMVKGMVKGMVTGMKKNENFFEKLFCKKIVIFFFEKNPKALKNAKNLK